MPCLLQSTGLWLDRLILHIIPIFIDPVLFMHSALAEYGDDCSCRFSRQCTYSYLHMYRFTLVLVCISIQGLRAFVVKCLTLTRYAGCVYFEALRWWWCTTCELLILICEKVRHVRTAFAIYAASALRPEEHHARRWGHLVKEGDRLRRTTWRPWPTILPHKELHWSLQETQLDVKRQVPEAPNPETPELGLKKAT